MGDFGGLLSIALLGFWVYCIIDVAMSDTAQVRNLPKWAWLAIVVLLWVLGGVLWWLIGRPHRTTELGGGERRERMGVARPTIPRRPRAPQVDKPEDESVIRARIEERDRLLARWAEEDRGKPKQAETGSAGPDTTT